MSRLPAGESSRSIPGGGVLPNVSDSYSSSGTEADRDADPEKKDRAERTVEAEEQAAAEAEEDAENVESEWHVWILAAVVVAGIALFFAPRFFLPELLGSLGLFLVFIGVLGWAIKWAIERTA